MAGVDIRVELSVLLVLAILGTSFFALFEVETRRYYELRGWKWPE